MVLKGRTCENFFGNTAPLNFLDGWDCSFFLIATACFIPIFFGFLHTGQVLRFPTLIVISGLYVISFLLWMCGLLLDVIAKKHRQLFELYLNLMPDRKRESDQ